MSYGDSYRISIETLENGFKVETPDMEARAKKEAEAKKRMKGSDGCYPTPYYGDCTKSYAAKSIKEVMKLVQASLEGIPDQEFDAAFEEKSASKD